MDHSRESLRPVEGAARGWRRRLGLRQEFALAILPTATLLAVLVLVEALSRQRLPFASLASSAFLIYLDPQHGTNTVRTLVLAQMTAAAVGLVTFAALGPGYAAMGSAMVVVIALMILWDAVHPPAVSTALSFALRAGDESNLAIFGLAAAVTAILVVLQRMAVWQMRRHLPKGELVEGK